MRALEPSGGCSPGAWEGDAESAFRLLESSSAGLSEVEAARRLQREGPNVLPAPRGRPLSLRLLDLVTHRMAVLLWAAGVLAFLAGTPELGWAIWAVIVINAGFGFWQEWRAERALEALERLLPVRARVLRSGVERQIPAAGLVPGDLMQLEEGDHVSADARLVTATCLLLDTSVLTGESAPVARHDHPVIVSEVHPADIPNVVLAGTTVAGGRGTAVVFATGARTEFGRIAHLTAGVQRSRSTLEVEVDRLVSVITLLSVLIGVAVFSLATLLIHMDIREAFLLGVGVIVANVPEGLLPTVTLALAVGVRRMARDNALVRRLSAVEALGAVTMICTDKTGTLTENEMIVRSLWVPPPSPEAEAQQYEGAGRPARTDSPRLAGEATGAAMAPGGELLGAGRAGSERSIKLLLAAGALCSNARLMAPSYDGWHVLGDPTEAALLVAAVKARLSLAELQHCAPRLREVAFDSNRKMMSVVVRNHLEELWPLETSCVCFTKGAPQEVSERCSHMLAGTTRVPMTAAARAEVAAANDFLASQGLRVLAIALREGAAELLEMDVDALENGLTLIGLTAMLDPPRPDVASAIECCRRAGIRITMITGDYGITAAAIARSIGLSRDPTRVVRGELLDEMTDESLREVLASADTLIFSRAQPEHKLRIVEACKAMGHVVAVTGDGVNDAPALRAAHVGIAMGRRGTDVAREAADVILLDDHFATIVKAIEQGRAIFRNIRKFLIYVMSSNVGELAPFVAMVGVAVPPALNIQQILAIDLGTDMVPALALGAEPAEPGLMEEAPRARSERLLTGRTLLLIYGFLGAIEGVAGLLAFTAVWHASGYTLADVAAQTRSLLSHAADPAVAAVYVRSTTAALAAIVACQAGNLFACRALNVPIWQQPLGGNALIYLGLAVEIAALLAIVYVPPLAAIFRTAPLGAGEWAQVLAWPFVMVAANEIRKAWLRRWQGR